MDKNAIKKFAVWARTELIARVSLKGVEYGITEDNMVDANADSVGGKVLTANEKAQRKALIAEINDKGYKQVMEEVAYTWFNRFSALRFMEVNGYLPSHVRVFTDEENNFKPQIITEAIHLDLDGLDMEKVYELKDAEKTEELYKYLLIVQCNALNAILPGMFQKIADYTELLLPDNLLREGSVIQQMIELIPEDDWKDAVQIIGWLYQYYNSEKKNDVFAALKKNVKITKENIPAATQLFTPDWIVRYMVENSLGRLWLEGHPDVKEQFLPTEEEQSAYAAGNRDPEDTKWHYYLEEANQEPEVQAQLAEIRKEYAALTPDQLKVIDPCSGSGHILAYLFDVLMQIYESYGYTTREAVASIVENNLYGLDIDDRAAQLAYFAVMMKARQYDRRFFSRDIQPHVYAIAESNHVDSFALEYFCDDDAKLKKAMDTIIKELHDAKEYGSILTVTSQDWSALYDRFAEITEDINMSRETALRELLPLAQVAEALAQKYDTVVTNPPYMADSGMSPHLLNYVKDNFKNYRNDLYSCFMKKTIAMLKANRFTGLMTSYTWMFLTAFSKMRIEMLSENSLVTLVQPEYHAFFKEAFVPICTFVLTNRCMNYAGKYIQLAKFTGAEEQEKRTLDAIMSSSCDYKFTVKQSLFYQIPDMPIAYWLKPSTAELFINGSLLSKYADLRQGLITGDNDRFLRFWSECDARKISTLNDRNKKWFFYHKGGEYRKWYGNMTLVVNWENDGFEIVNFRDDKGKQRSRPQNIRYYLQEGFTWTALTVADFNVRYMPEGGIFDAKGSSGFCNEKDNLKYIIGLCNSKVSMEFLSFLAPTMDYSAGAVGKVPTIICEEKKAEISNVVTTNIEISKSDWDSYEISWDFQHHPLLRSVPIIAEAFDQWQAECDERFNQLKDNEEELNRIFIDIYGLRDELTPEVEDKDVTVRKADLGRDIRSFISYAVGCMFGRYSLYKDGLIFAGESYSLESWVEKMNDQPGIISHEELVRAYCNEGVIVNEMFFPDEDNIIPICDDEYFTDDIVGRFVEFVAEVYGADTLDENLKFIADALGGNGQPKDVIRKYFLSEFYSDHCKIYQKRPIYWLFDSGKKNGFKALIYMHRYQPDTIARIRTDYVHEQQARYRTAIADLEQRIANASTGERVKLNKRLKALNEQAAEIHAYEEKIHHLADQMISIDLDDGVKKNYAIFQDVLAKIK